MNNFQGLTKTIRKDVMKTYKVASDKNGVIITIPKSLVNRPKLIIDPKYPNLTARIVEVSDDVYLDAMNRNGGESHIPDKIEDIFVTKG